MTATGQLNLEKIPQIPTEWYAAEPQKGEMGSHCARLRPSVIVLCFDPQLKPTITSRINHLKLTHHNNQLYPILGLLLCLA